MNKLTAKILTLLMMLFSLSAYANGAIGTASQNVLFTITNLSCGSNVTLRLNNRSNQLEHLYLETLNSDSNGALPITSMTNANNAFSFTLGNNCQSTVNMSVTLKATYPANQTTLDFTSDYPNDAESSIQTDSQEKTLMQAGEQVLISTQN